MDHLKSDFFFPVAIVTTVTEDFHTAHKIYFPCQNKDSYKSFYNSFFPFVSVKSSLNFELFITM